jgi:hypothetical protein
VSGLRHIAAAVLVTSAAPAAAAEVNGYLDSRTQYTRSRVAGLIDTRDQPQLAQLLEGNVQLKHSFAERSFLAADVSLFAQAAGVFRTLDQDGNEVAVPDHEVPASRPLVSLSEVYWSHDVLPELSLLVGKKRVVWGAGLAFNPTDLINPPKDPTDPSFQRAGAWMARVEVPLEAVAFTVLFAPQVTRQENGIPSRFLYYPRWDPAGDDQPHYLVAARAYALIAETDVNGMLFFSNRYRDLLDRSFKMGASVSRILFDALEVHAEALAHAGSSRSYPNHGCLVDLPGALGCARRGEPFMERRQLGGESLTTRALLGARYQLDDDTLLSAEYLFQSDGYTRQDLQSLVNALALVRAAGQIGLDPAVVGVGAGVGPGAGSAADGSPQKLSFEPLGRHHLFLSFSRSRIRDDFSVSAVLMGSLQDLSGLFSPSLSWQATEWLTVTASGMVPFPGWREWAATIPETDEPVSEYTLLPLDYRAILQVRAFY